MKTVIGHCSEFFNLSKVVGNSMDSELNYSLSLFTDEFFFSDSGSGQKINWKLK